MKCDEIFRVRPPRGAVARFLVETRGAAFVQTWCMRAHQRAHTPLDEKTLTFKIQPPPTDNTAATASPQGDYRRFSPRGFPCSRVSERPPPRNPSASDPSLLIRPGTRTPIPRRKELDRKAVARNKRRTTRAATRLSSRRRYGKQKGRHPAAAAATKIKQPTPATRPRTCKAGLQAWMRRRLEAVISFREGKRKTKTSPHAMA